VHFGSNPVLLSGRMLLRITEQGGATQYHQEGPWCCIAL